MTANKPATQSTADIGQPRKSALLRLARPLVTLVCLILVATVLWQLLPKSSFSSDLTQVGQGRPALVLMREVQVMGGERVLEQMHTIYPEFEQSMVFLLVHTGNPSGMQFAAEHNVRDADVVLFDGQGRALATIRHPASAAELHRFITDTLAAAGI